ncbi:MAG: hypothetical protein P4L34_04945 [Paludibacter sp.]|nr:hypothetical protein [Paludibacter sp.]
MKKNSFLVIISGFMLALTACSSNSDLIDATANYPKAPASFVKSKNLTGTLKGTLKQDSTYYLVGDVAVAKGDTLAVQPGATIIAKGNFQFQISGTLLSLGTEAKQVTFTSQDASRFTDFATYTGHWGGFVFDSTAVYVYVKYTHINFTGGPDSSGSPQASFDVEGSQTYNGGAYIVVEDSWFYGGVDDGIHLAGNITASIKRNVIQRLGGPDGETMNVKKGVKGDIAYNYIWSAANNAIKLETGTVLIPQTNMNIFNNTIVDGGFRKRGEATNSILIDKWTRANIYNNLMVGNHTGINITTKADTTNCKYGNNLIYCPADSLTQLIYPLGAFSKKQSTDITGTGATLCNSVITTWVPPTTTLPDLTVLDGNNPSLPSSSPAIGKGIAVAPFTYFITSIDGKKGTADVVNKDLGAYPTDGSGNKHLPTKQPVQ